ncbi:MAG: TonB-dependent receptor [Ignavibacteriales bacterium]|nr:TonB-dependent receptor [Ignavibacteriales bacterium]MCF8316248.1 TonB-dependent receptor [Ignavibacteriales bacterium]MCF8437832.1 TonB-dependent receptor [Ignavibacteriales bacterium]
MKNFNQSIIGILMLLGLMFIFPQTGYAQKAKISGTIKDNKGEGIMYASVQVMTTQLGTAADMAGKYWLQIPDAGKYTIKISAVGYQSQSVDLTLEKGQELIRDFVLGEDILNMDQVVVTGTSNPKTKLESSVAITTLPAKELERISPRNAMDLVKLVPGFYTESSGGEGNANVMARGLDNSGGLRYVQLQEDNLPVFEYGDLMFGNSDIWVRVDNTVDRLEGVRGGSSSILTSNAPGGIINFVSRTGGPTFSGAAKFTTGDYGLYRTDMYFGGPVTENLRFFLGGFYRTDKGIRSPGYTANQGGQIKGNLTYLMDKGYVKVSFKYLDDKVISYLPIPLTGDDPSGITGFDPNYGTVHSVDLMNLHIFTPRGSEFSRNLSDGMHPQVSSIGSEFVYSLDGGYTIENNFRYSSMNGQFNSIYLNGGPWKASEYAQSRGLTNYTYSYARGYNAGVAIANPDALNGNGLVGTAWWWDVNIPLEYFTNNITFSKQFDKLNVKVGDYFSVNRVKSVWWWHTMLIDFNSEGTRTLNLFDNASNKMLTSNGYTQFGDLFYKNYSATTTINAPFVYLEYKPISDLNIEAGLRYDIGQLVGWSEKDNTYSYDVDGDGTITSAETNVHFGTGVSIPFNFDYNGLSWSLGANYSIASNMAVFARASQGKRAPADRDYAFGATEATQDGMPEGTKAETITQIELGGKYASPTVAFFANLFYSLSDDKTFVDLTSAGAVKEAYNTTAMGLEVEVVTKLGDLSLNLSGTIQDLRYNDWIYHDATGKEFNFDGKQIQRIPALYFIFRPSYQLGSLNLNAAVEYFSDRYTSPDNIQTLPAFYQLNLGAEYSLTKTINWGIYANNVTNVIGLTEGNPSAGLAPGAKSAYYYARPILGRSIITSLSVQL